MVREAKLIDEGRKVVDQVAKVWHLAFAVWYTDPQTQQPYLSIGAEEFDQSGPKGAYTKINAELSKVKGIHFIKPDMIKVVSLESDLGQTLNSRFGNQAEDTAIGMLSSPTLVLFNVFSYGLSSTKKI